MEKGLPLVADVYKRARAHHVKIVLGTDAVAGSHGRNAEEFIYRVKDGGDKPMDALADGDVGSGRIARTGRRDRLDRAGHAGGYRGGARQSAG